MLSVTLTKAGKSSKLRVEAKRGTEVVVFQTFASDNVQARNSVAALVHTDPSKFLQLCMSVGEATPVTFEANEPIPGQLPPLTVTVRGKTQKASEGHVETGDPVEVIAAAVSLKNTGLTDPIVEWADESVACFLDVDYHRGGAPSESRLAFMVASIQPQPVLWFRSRSGGLHALYVVRDSIPANVLAGVAGFSVKTIDPSVRYDIIPRSRLAPGDVHRITPTSDLGHVRRFLSGTIDDNEVTDYLDRRGVERTKAYPHTQCPIEPTEGVAGTPVYFGDTAVVCKRCEAKGVTFGSRRPGVFPYASLCGSHELNDVAKMIENYTHYTHAEVVLEARCRLRGRHARLAYEGMLRLRHGDDHRVESCFTRGRSLLRGVGRWVTPTRFEGLKQIRQTLASLPAVQGQDGKPIAERLDMFDQTVDLTEYGYPSVKPLRGMRLFGEKLSDSVETLSVVIPPPNLVGLGQRNLWPRYVDERKRMNLSEAWGRLEAVFPGINREYLKLLLVARGVCESESGSPPFILCTGVAGSGKSASPQIAAALCGDFCTDMDWKSDDARFRQAYQKGTQDGSFVVINELIKTARTHRKTPREAFDSFLTLTPNSVSHEMYTGPVPLGRVPATIVTDTFVPPEVRSDAQIGRRFVYVGLRERLFWDTTLYSSGVVLPENFRAHSVENAEAGNAICSDVVDTFFSSEPRPFAAMAADLGFSTLEHCDVMSDDPDALPALFRAVCEAQEITTDSRLRGRGWKKIDFEFSDSPLAEAWREVCDSTSSFEGFKHSRKVQEQDWSLLVPVPKRTEVDIMPRSKSIAIRFRYGSPKGGNYAVNGELLTCDGERR